MIWKHTYLLTFNKCVKISLFPLFLKTLKRKRMGKKYRSGTQIPSLIHWAGPVKGTGLAVQREHAPSWSRRTLRTGLVSCPSLSGSGALAVLTGDLCNSSFSGGIIWLDEPLFTSNRTLASVIGCKGWQVKWTPSPILRLLPKLLEIQLVCFVVFKITSQFFFGLIKSLFIVFPAPFLWFSAP